MLDAGTAPRRIAGLTVFSDHADPRVHYTLAEVPRVRADPDPRLSLTLFRGEQSGALLQLETVLAPTEAQLEATHQALSVHGPPRLVRPDWRSGQVHLAGWLEADELEPLMRTVGTPSLVGDPSSMIAARLDQNAAALAERALRGGNALPTVIIYELELIGLAGPLGIEAEADLRAIHDRLTIEGALTTPYGRARIAKTWEEFAKDNLIRIRVLDESGDVESRRAEALTRVGSELVATMFSPVPPPEAPAMMTDDAVGAVELSFKLTKRREELQTSSRWSYLERSARRIVHHAAASLIGVLGDSPVERHVVFADLAAPSRTIVVRAEPELPALGLAALEVELQLGGTEAPADENETETPATAETRSTDATDDADMSSTADERTAGLAATLTPEDDEVTLEVERDPTEPLWYRVLARFDPELTHAADRRTGWYRALGSTVLVSGRRLFPPRSLTVATGRLELDWLDHVEVLVQPPDEQQPARTVVLSEGTRSARADFLAPGEGPLTVTAYYRGKEGEPSRSDPPRSVAAGEDLVVLDGPFDPSVDVLVVPLPLPGVLSVVAELEPSHEDWPQTKSVSWDLPDTAPQRVSLRRPRGAPESYRFRTTIVRDDGRIDATEWTESTEPTLVVGADGPVTVHRTDVFVLGGGPVGRGSFAIELVLAAGETSTTTLLEGSTDQAALVLVAPQDGPAPTLTVREITNTGRTLEHQLTEITPLTVIPLPPPTGTDAP